MSDAEQPQRMSVARDTNETTYDATSDRALDTEMLERSKATNTHLPEPELPPRQVINVRGIDVSYRDFAPTADASENPTTYLLIHGLGGSMSNWAPIVRQLQSHGRVLTPDLAGFGFTAADVEHASVQSNADLMAAFARALGVDNVCLAGNSMGGMVAALVAGRHPNLVRNVVLIDPVLPLDPRTRSHWSVTLIFTMYLCGPLARRVLPRYAARLGAERMAREGVENVVADPARVPGWVVDRAIEETLERTEAHATAPAMVRAAQSLVKTAGLPSYDRLLRSLRQPVTLIHGDRDGLVSVRAARRMARRAPSWAYIEAPGVGHVPMFEVADWVASQIVEAGQ